MQIFFFFFLFLFSFYSYPQFVELLLCYRSRAATHDIASTVVLREGYEVANAVGTAKEGAETVEAESQSGMWRGTIGESIHQETELLGSFLVGKT